jgi:hypothetical protein
MNITAMLIIYFAIITQQAQQFIYFVAVGNPASLAIGPGAVQPHRWEQDSKR